MNNATVVRLCALAVVLLVFAGTAAARSAVTLVVEMEAGASADLDAMRRMLERDFDASVMQARALAALDSFLFELRPRPGVDSGRLAAALRRDPRISHVQSNRLHHVAGMPVKDPYFDLQARTRRGGIDAVLRRGSGRNVRIAVIDTGVDVTHPDLVGQLTEVVNFVGGAGRAAVPAEFHGTAVVGLISATPNNGIGIHGLAPAAEMHALRACWEPTYGYGLCSTYTLAQALSHAIEIRARIINLSLAGPDDPMLTRLVERAIELGAVVFGAIGEDSGQNFPASSPGVIAVEQGHTSATAVGGARLTVPGQQLLTAVPGGRYDFVSGSSFATAHASGVAAVMLEQQPHLKADELVAWLRALHGNDAAQ